MVLWSVSSHPRHVSHVSVGKCPHSRQIGIFASFSPKHTPGGARQPKAPWNYTWKHVFQQFYTATTGLVLISPMAEVSRILILLWDSLTNWPIRPRSSENVWPNITPPTPGEGGRPGGSLRGDRSDKTAVSGMIVHGNSLMNLLIGICAYMLYLYSR